MYYLRSQDGLEVDLLIEAGGRVNLFEIKSAMTITPKHAASLKRMMKDMGGQVKTASIISCSEKNFVVTGNIVNYGWKNILTL